MDPPFKFRISNFKLTLGLDLDFQERREIGKAREELAWELGRAPTDEETMRKAGVSPARYRDVARMSRPAGSLHARNRVTQEELINEVTDADAVGAADTHRHSNRLLRLAIDDLVSTFRMIKQASWLIDLSTL